MKNLNRVKHSILLGVLVFLVLIVSFLYINGKLGLIQDEYYHYDQIMRFATGEKNINPGLMTLPGYHFIISLILKITHQSSVLSVRTISFVINLIVIPVFYLLAAMVDKKSSSVKTLQFSFFPLLFPFFPFIYTDIFSLLLILLSFYWVLSKRYFLSGLAGVISLVIRQNNIFWLIFLNLILYIENYGEMKREFIPMRNEIANGITIRTLHPDVTSGLSYDRYIIRHLIKSYIYFAGVVILVLFIILNRGIVLSDYAKGYMHLGISNLGNIYFFLFLHFFLFLPITLKKIFSFANLKLNRFSTRLPFLLIISGLLFGFFTFVNDHPFNHAVWFLHNYLLVLFTSNLYWKAAFFLLAGLSVYALSMTRIYKRYGAWLYLFSFLYLLPYWLIEPRYYLIPATLFLLLKERGSLLSEYFTLAIYIIVSIFLLNGTANFRFFL